MTDEEVLKKLFRDKLNEEQPEPKPGKREPVYMGELIQGNDGVYRCPSVINRGN